MNIEDVRIVKGALSDRVYAGKLNKSRTAFTQKKDVTNDFIATAISRWKGYKEVVSSSDGKRYEISITEL